MRIGRFAVYAGITLTIMVGIDTLVDWLFHDPLLPQKELVHDLAFAIVFGLFSLSHRFDDNWTRFTAMFAGTPKW